MAECLDETEIIEETFFEGDDQEGNDKKASGVKLPALVAAARKLPPTLPPQLSLTSAFIRITNKASEKVQELKVGSGYAVVVQEKKVVIMKESTTEPAQQTPAEPGTMLQLPHDTLLDVSMTGNGKIHLTSNLMKNVEVQCVLELASKVSAWGLQMEIIRFMQYRDKKLDQTPHTMECQEGEEEAAQNVPETSFLDTNDTELGLDEVPEGVPPAESRSLKTNAQETSFQGTNDTELGLDEVPEVVPPAESRSPAPEPTTEERKARIELLLADGYVEGTTCVTDKHRNHDVYATLLVKVEERAVVCKRCFRGFLLDARADIGLTSHITKHSRTLCNTIQSENVPDGPLYTTSDLSSHADSISPTINSPCPVDSISPTINTPSPARPPVGIDEEEVKHRLARQESIALDVFNTFSHSSRKAFQKSLNDYVKRRREQPASSRDTSDTSSLPPLERNKRVLPLPSKVATEVDELMKTHRNEIEEYKNFLRQTNMFKVR